MINFTYKLQRKTLTPNEETAKFRGYECNLLTLGFELERQWAQYLTNCYPFITFKRLLSPKNTPKNMTQEEYDTRAKLYALNAIADAPLYNAWIDEAAEVFSDFLPNTNFKERLRYFLDEAFDAQRGIFQRQLGSIADTENNTATCDSHDTTK
jgi:hypothetical protein